MCHWIREPDPERDRASLPASIPPRRSLFSPRPALALLAVVLVAVFAVAALFFPSSTTAVSTTRAASPTPVVESTPTGPDDAVPSTIQASRSSSKSGAHCNHDM